MKKVFSLFSGIFLLLTIIITHTSCIDDTTEAGKEYCHKKGMLYCSDKEGGCCDTSVPYTDGHGTCYNTLSYCRQSGWACTKCW